MTTTQNRPKRLRCFGDGCEHSIDGHVFTSVSAAADHENAYHDGAQTCWDESEQPPVTMTFLPSVGGGEDDRP